MYAIIPTHVSIEERRTSFKSCFNDEYELSDDNDEFDSAAAALAAVQDVVFEANEYEEDVVSAESGIIAIVFTARNSNIMTANTVIGGIEWLISRVVKRQFWEASTERERLRCFWPASLPPEKNRPRKLYRIMFSRFLEKRR